MARGLSHGEIRLFRFPAPDRQRPVLILTRSSALEFLNRVTVAPITSTVRGIPTEVVLDVEDGMKGTCAANLDHVITVPKAEIGRLIATLRRERWREICYALEFAFQCTGV